MACDANRKREFGPVALIGSATAFSLLGDQMLYAVLPTCFLEVGLQPYQVGLVLSANRWIRLITNRLAHHLCERMNLAVLVTAAFGLGAAITLTYAYVASFALLLLARVLWGLCWSFIRQIGVMTAVDSAAEGHLGRTMGFYSGISRTGSLAGNLVGAIGYDIFGFSVTLAAFGVISAVAMPLGILSRRRVVHQNVEITRSKREDRADFALLGCGFVVGCVGPGLVMSTLGLILKGEVGDKVEFLGISLGVATLTGILLAGRWLADLLGAPMMGHLSDHLGRRRSTMLYYWLGSVVLLLGSLVEGAAFVIVSVLLFFVCGVGATVVLMAEAGSRGSRAVASYATASDLGSAVGPILGWSLQQAALSTDVMIQAGSIMYASGALLAIRVFDDRVRSR